MSTAVRRGQADKLEALLQRLGYARTFGDRVPPRGRQALLLSGLIDRRPDQIKVVNAVRSMIDAGHARSVMGNHEFSAIGYTTERRGAPSELVRTHGEKNKSQHVEFLDQVVAGSALHRALIEWFKSLPLMLDLGDIRVVHAWWHEPSVDLVTGHLPSGRPMGGDFLHAAYVKG